MPKHVAVKVKIQSYMLHVHLVGNENEKQPTFQVPPKCLYVRTRVDGVIIENNLSVCTYLCARWHHAYLSSEPVCIIDGTVAARCTT